MLDQTVATPSPTDTVNLMPSVKKNFNATNVFKKAARAVGMLRKLQASESKSRPEASTSGGANGIGSQAHSPVNVVSFHDIVSAALLSKKALDNGQKCPVKTDSGNSSGSDGHEQSRSDSDEHLNEVSAILDGLGINP